MTDQWIYIQDEFYSDYIKLERVWTAQAARWRGFTAGKHPQFPVLTVNSKMFSKKMIPVKLHWFCLKVKID